MGFLAMTLGHAVPLDQRLARRLAVVRATVRGSPDPDRKTLARGHALRFTAPSGDLSVLATFLASDTCHAVIVRRPWSCRKWPDGMRKSPRHLRGSGHAARASRIVQEAHLGVATDRSAPMMLAGQGAQLPGPPPDPDVPRRGDLGPLGHLLPTEDQVLQGIGIPDIR